MVRTRVTMSETIRSRPVDISSVRRRPVCATIRRIRRGPTSKSDPSSRSYRFGHGRHFWRVHVRSRGYRRSRESDDKHGGEKYAVKSKKKPFIIFRFFRRKPLSLSLSGAYIIIIINIPRGRRSRNHRRVYLDDRLYIYIYIQIRIRACV